MNDGANPLSMVVLTFTTAAAKEIQDRLGAAKLGYAGTLHGYLLGLIQDNWQALGYASRRLAVLDEEQAKELLERTAAELGYKGPKKDLSIEMASHPRSGTPSKAYLVISRYFTQLKENGLITFDTILSQGLSLFKSGLIHQIEYLFVDEVQDASDMDFAIYDAMLVSNRLYVGDPDQSIFSFRGGNVANINGLLDRNGPGEFLPILLEDNYRSDRRITSAANRLIGHNTGRVEKCTYSVSEEPGDVMVTPCESADGEIRNATHLLRTLDDQSCAVLLRTNVLVDEWTKALEGFGIPVAKRVRTEKPKDWALAKVVIGLLNDPDNDWLCYRYLFEQHGKTYADSHRLTANASVCSINSLTINLPPGTPLSAYGVNLARLGVSQESVALVETAIAGLPSKFPLSSTGTDLMAALAEAEHTQEEIGHGVHVGTYHSAKGLEFSCVLLPACEQEIIPGNKTGDALQEERRLFYVGITRARHRLFISYARSRKPAFGGWKPVVATVSQFVQEAGL